MKSATKDAGQAKASAPGKEGKPGKMRTMGKEMPSRMGAQGRKIRFVDTYEPGPLKEYVARFPDLKRVLDERLALQKKKGRIESEQWYRDPAIWLSATAMINPYQAIFSELEIIQHQLEKEDLMWKDRFSPPSHLSDRIVFFGVGNSDSEIALLRKAYDGYLCCPAPCIYAIDVQEQFLRIFAQNCLSLFRSGTSRLFPPISQQPYFYFQGYESLFQDISPDDLALVPECLRGDTFYPMSPDLLREKNLFVALGNVVGNFEDQGEIFSIFRKLGAKTLVIGAHLCHCIEHLCYLVEQYRMNEILSDLVLAPYVADGGPRPEVIWKANGRDTAIIAELEDGTRLFYSKKYSSGELEEYAKKFGFSTSQVYRHMHSALYIFKRGG